MNRQLDFTIDPINYVGLGDFVKQIKEEGTRYIIILVSYKHIFPGEFSYSCNIHHKAHLQNKISTMYKT